MLDCGTVPRMDVVEVPLSIRQARHASGLLEWRNQILAFPDIGLVAQQTLSIIQRRAVLTEQLDVRGNPDVGTTVPDQVASVVAHALNLRKITYKHTILCDEIVVHRKLSMFALLSMFGANLDHMTGVFAVVEVLLCVSALWTVDDDREGIN